MNTHHICVCYYVFLYSTCLLHYLLVTKGNVKVFNSDVIGFVRTTRLQLIKLAAALLTGCGQFWSTEIQDIRNTL